VGDWGQSRIGIVTIAGIALAMLAPAAAPAAQVIGQTGSPIDDCAQDKAFTQGSISGGASYSPGARSVITSWSAQAEATANRTLKLLVLRPDPGNGPRFHTVVGSDTIRTLSAPNALNVFTGLRLPIGANEQLGLYVPAGQPGGFSSCRFTAGGASDAVISRKTSGEPSFGTSLDYDGTASNARLNAAATVEPDADGDGFGDETQDQCPSQASTQAACASTAARVKKKCKRKKKRSAGTAKKKRCKKKRK